MIYSDISNCTFTTNRKNFPFSLTNVATKYGHALQMQCVFFHEMTVQFKRKEKTTHTSYSFEIKFFFFLMVNRHFLWYKKKEIKKLSLENSLHLFLWSESGNVITEGKKKQVYIT